MPLLEPVSPRGSLRFTGGTGSTLIDFTAGIAATTGELLFANSESGVNGIAIQNTAADGFSALAVRAADGRERLAIGYGNSTTAFPWTNASYLEASFYPTSGTTAPPYLRFVQTGYMNGANGNYRRLEFMDDSNIRFFQKDGSTDSLAIDPDGVTSVFCNKTGANAFQIKNTHTAGYSSVKVMDTAGTERMVFGYGNSTAASYTSLAYVISGSGAALVFGQGGTERMRQTPNGGFAIGTTTDPGAGALLVTAFVRIVPVAIASLPSAATAGAGARAHVTDALAPVFGATVAAAGAVSIPVYSDGTNWKVG